MYVTKHIKHFPKRVYSDISISQETRRISKLTPKELEKEQSQNQKERNYKFRVEIDEIEAEKRVEKIYERADSEKKNKISRHLARLMKRQHKSIKLEIKENLQQIPQ